MARYHENKLLYKGRLEDVFFRLQAFYYQRNTMIAAGYLPGIDLNASKRNLQTTYIAIRIVSLLVKKPVDLLFGENSTFSSGQSPSSPEQAALDRIVNENHFHTALMELGLGNGIRGDALLKVRIDPSRPCPTVVESQDAAFWIPEHSPGDKRRVLKHHICVPIMIRDPKSDLYETYGMYSDEEAPGTKHYLLVETHTPGKIANRLFRMGRMGIDIFGMPDYTIEEEISLSTLFGDDDPREPEVDTGVPFPLVVHIPNERTDSELYGSDDIDELKPLLDELSNRITQISQILDKHADPILALPSGTMDQVDDGNGGVKYVYRAQDNKAIEVDSKEDMVPEYITWDGHLDAAFKELEKVLDLIFMIAEIPRMIVGGDSEKSGGTSGAAALNTKYRLLPLLAKVNRKKQYLDKGIREALYIAQLLETKWVATYHDGAAFFEDWQEYTPQRPKIIWADGLPKDEMQEAQIMQIRTGNEPTIDPIEAIQRLDGKTEEQAQETVKRIQDHLAATQAVASSTLADNAVNGGGSAKDRIPLGT